MSSGVFSHGNRTKDFTEAFRDMRACSDARHTFIISDDLDKGLAAATTLERQGAPNSLADSGAMYLEMAFSASTDEDTRLGFFEQARKNLSTATDRQPTAHDTAVAKAQMYINALPILQHLLLTDQPGTIELAEKSYHENISFGSRLIDHFETLDKRTLSHRNMRRQMIGSLAELSVELLLQRHSVLEIEDPNTLALPTFFSEDGSASRGGSKNNTWDISFFADENVRLFDPTYKIQVKANHNKRETRMYADDIAIVRANVDLNLDKRQRGRWPIFAIIEECATELSSAEDSARATERLDRRTGLLLDTIDPPQ